MRSIRANHSIVAVSAYQKETAINTAQDLDLSLLCNVGDFITFEPRREDNTGEMTGREEADTIYDMGGSAKWSPTFEKAQPQHFAFLYGYGLGNAAAGAAGSGRLHTITPIQDDYDSARSLPSFTAGQRLGKTITKERFYSMFVNEVTSTFARGDFCKVSGSCVGTGKRDSSVIEETVSAAENVTTLTLAANGVAGATAAERLDSIHQIRAELTPGVWTEVDYTAVSSASPAEITIAAPGAGTTNRNFKILYAPTEAAWMTMPARISETPLRISELKFRIGGRYDGTAIQGGREMGVEINSIEHKLSNNGNVEFPPGAGGAYASKYFRDGRTQVLTLDREFQDYIVQHYMSSNEQFAASILAEGMEFDAGHRYGVEIIFPRLGVLQAPVSVNGKRLAEKGDMTVLEDDTYGSVIVKVKNLQQNYAN